MSPERAAVAATDAADAVRELNHATLDPTDIGVEVVYASLGELTRLEFGLGQAIGQLETAVVRRHLAGRLASTGDVTADVGVVVGQLGAAAQLAVDLAARIAAAHEAVSRLSEPR